MTATTVQQVLPVTLDAYEVSALDWQPFPGVYPVQYKLLWRSGWSVAGILRVPRGASFPAHTHEKAQHHLWVISGSADMLGRRMEAGSYLHVPAGVPHGIDAAGPDGLEVLYLYLHDGDEPPG
jgi:oxalate decarboxylase/phosphoglucose isomerase-like protein (cupin superfamily)